MIRYYARRTKTGVWLDTDVQLTLEPTYGLNADATSVGRVPAAYVVETATDGSPMWLERGTTLYRESEGQLDWAGLCSYVRPTELGLEVEFTDLFGAFDLIDFTGSISGWQLDPFDAITQLIANGQGNNDAPLGFVVTTTGVAPARLGDPKPPPKPPKPPRRKGESKDDYDDRLLTWEESVDTWDRLYGELKPYTLTVHDAQYVGDELRRIVEDTPLQFVTRYSWADRDALIPRHEARFSPVQFTRRSDVALVEGTNLTSRADVRTSIDTYGNRFVAVGAGDAPRTLLGYYSSPDARIRTTRFVENKTIATQAGITAYAASQGRQGSVTRTVEEATVTADVGALINPGDEIRLTLGDRFDGWCRVEAVTRPLDAPATIRFRT